MSKIVCHCNQITEKEIVSFIKKYPQADFEAIKAGTYVSTGCGRCANACKTLILKTKKQSPPQLQFQLPFSE